MGASPLRILTVTAATYSCIFTGSQYFSWPTNNPRANLKAISSLHSLVTTGVGLVALLETWPVDTGSIDSSKSTSSNAYLDDTHNPMISGKSHLGNAVTSFETGYLLYDNFAVFLVTRSMVYGLPSPSVAAMLHLVKNEPLLVVHHLAILTGLGILQSYITEGKERGIWIIVAFVLMRASDPILHWRWWMRKRTGKPDARLDLLLAAVFAICRLGTISWVLKAYGAYHRLNTWKAFMKQRLICKAGTGALFWLNALWLATLLRNTGRRLLQNRKMNGVVILGKREARSGVTYTPKPSSRSTPTF